ncbi:MAG: hypothetical protein P4L81_00845 [Candidatus Pacebacteria bacterium]|nr:hypothetical protein [Candidatus Paceibacterota bacterium]
MLFPTNKALTFSSNQYEELAIAAAHITFGDYIKLFGLCPPNSDSGPKLKVYKCRCPIDVLAYADLFWEYVCPGGTVCFQTHIPE